VILWLYHSTDGSGRRETGMPAHAAADRCIARLDAEQLDISQLFGARHWEWLDCTEQGRGLKRFLEVDMGLHRQEAVCAEFHARVHEVFQRRGIVNLAPERRVEAYRKEELFARYRAAEWPKPHTPYLIQMRPGLFVLLSNYQAGFHLIRDMAGSRKYQREDGRYIPVTLLYEGQMEEIPCRIILDCEAYVSQFEGRLSHAELLESVREVPQAFVRRLARLEAIPRDCVVRVYEKDKCRGDKISFHYIFNILMSDPTVDGRNALAQAIIEPFRGERAVWKETKSMVHTLDPETRQCKEPLLHVDACTVKGRHQFSVVFSCKAGEEPCRITRRLEISERGERVREVASAWASEPHVPTHPHALEMLYYGGFTHWIKDSITIDKRFRIVAAPLAEPATAVRARDDCWPAARLELTRTPGWQAKKMVGAPRASASSRPAPFLPPWMKSVADRFGSGNYTEYRRMDCLVTRHKTLNKYVSGGVEEVVHVIGGAFCPVLTLYGVPRFHSSNGLFMAKGEAGVVYASCPSCVFEPRAVKKNMQELVKIVPGLEEAKNPWVMYTEEGYPRVTQAATTSRETHPASNKGDKKKARK